MKFKEFSSLKELLENCPETYKGEEINCASYFIDKSGLYPLYHFCPQNKQLRELNKFSGKLLVSEASTLEAAWDHLKNGNKKLKELHQLNFIES